MNLQQLQYVLTIAQEGSFTKASHVLFKSQPSISNAIKELEEELHIQIFNRSFDGVYLTPEGEEFVKQASNIIEQVQTLKTNFQKKRKENSFSFKVSISRSSYMIRALSYWIDQNIDENIPLHITLQETNTNKVIEDINSGQSELGIIRIPKEQQYLYDKLLEKRNIKQHILMEFPLRLVFKKDHPLCKYEDVPYEMLEPYTEIIHGDDSILAIQKAQINSSALMQHKKRKIYVYDRGSQINLLENIKHAYMWVSPIPLDMLEASDMVLKDCSFAKTINRDILIFRTENKEKPHIKNCITYIEQFVKELQESIEKRKKS